MSLTYFIQTFGCQMNFSDSERMSAVLEDLNIAQSTSIESADIIILNTCSVRQKAEDRINGLVKNLRDKLGESPIIVLTGCMARRIWDDSVNVKSSTQKNYDDRVDELKEFFPKVNIIVETKNFFSIGDKLSTILDTPSLKISNRGDNPEHYLSFKPKYKNSFQAYVPISTGCNHFCTFCIVPYSRGKEVCRDASEIIREVVDLVQRGYKDITLLGQTVNRWINPNFTNEFDYNEALTKIKGLNKELMPDNYLEVWKIFFKTKIEDRKMLSDQEFRDLRMPRDFLQLIQVLDQIPGDWWTTWVSSHPNYMTDELISYIGESSKGMMKDFNLHQKPYLHFALQSGSDKILKKMNRRYSMEEFFNIVELMRLKIENVSLSTDIIVGFVDETDEDFELTLNAQRDCQFDMIFISEYSPRKGTASARLVDNISLEIKSSRKEKLNNLLREIALNNNKSYLNMIFKVLIDNYSKKFNCLMGRTPHNKEIKLDLSDKSLIGRFVEVKVIDCTPWSLSGEVLK